MNLQCDAECIHQHDVNIWLADKSTQILYVFWNDFLFVNLLRVLFGVCKISVILVWRIQVCCKEFYLYVELFKVLSQNISRDDN